MVGVYKITNTKNGKVYIGQSIQIKKRFKKHKQDLRKNNHCNYRLQDEWNIYGEEAFTFEVVQKCRSVYLNEIEQHLIKEYHSTDEDKGYNISAGVGRNLSVRSWYSYRHSQPKKKVRVKSYRKEVINYAYFKNDSGEIEYNALCVACERECKQSFRSEILICPHLEKR